MQTRSIGGSLTFASPNKVTSIGNYAFSGCKLTELILPDEITAIGAGAFMNNATITTLKLPQNLERIGGGVSIFGNSNGAFTGLNQVTTLELPAGLVDIGDGAFEGMSALKTIIVNNPEPVIFTDATRVFEGIDKEKTILYVPVGTVDDYKEFDLWSDFANIREIGSDAEESAIEGFDDMTVQTGVEPITLSATPPGNQTITYTIEEGKTGVATLSGNVLTIVGEGTAQLTATAAGTNEYEETTKTITLTVVNTSWLEAVTILVGGNSAQVVGPAEAVARFTKFYVGEEEITLNDGVADLSEKTGELTLKVTTADGSEVIKLTINKQ